MSDYQFAVRKLWNLRVRKYAIVLSPLLLACAFVVCAWVLKDAWFYFSASGCGVLMLLLNFLTHSRLSPEIDRLTMEVARLEYLETKRTKNPTVRRFCRVLMAELLTGDPATNYANLRRDDQELVDQVRNAVQQPGRFSGAKVQQLGSLATRLEEQPNSPLVV